MRYRLNETHYDEMAELPAGTEVGDGTGVTWKYPETIDNVALRGKYKPPARSMTPLDDEAKKAYAEYFKTDAPNPDPDKKPTVFSSDPSASGTAAPSTGPAFTGKPIAPPARPNPAPNNPTEKAKTGIDPMKDDSVAKEDPLGNKTPEGHKPSESKPAGSK